MQEIYRVIARLMNTDLTVLIAGESGTGKELVARALHDFGKRKRRAVRRRQLAAIPRELIESELFGHEKGAFTGANARRRRAVRAGRRRHAVPRRDRRHAARGADPAAAGAAAGRVRAGRRPPPGPHQRPDRRGDAIAICALMVGQGLFREDLFYRLNVVPLRLPPLRERVDDIPALVQHFLVAGAGATACR